MQVNDRFKLDWGTYLTTSEQIIYGLIDGRGSGFKVRLGIRTSFCIITELAYGHKSGINIWHKNNVAFDEDVNTDPLKPLFAAYCIFTFVAFCHLLRQYAATV